ncbi:MAG: LPS assembly lipoprotein LptE [Caulobacteraceae bacterium]
MRVLIASLTLLLAACGFQPMYAPAGGGNAIGPVQIAEIEGKAGHVLRTELSRILAVENDGSPPAHLAVTLQESVTQLGIRRDESATRAELRLTANYILTPATPGARVMRGSVYTVVNYDIPTAAFGEISAQDDARERAAETMAQRFRAELALRMAQARQG